MTPRAAGFSLLELMIALAIAAILGSIAVKAYGNAALRVRTGIAASALHESTLRAQREALVRQAHIVMCSSPTGGQCSGDTVWEHGWIGFVDSNRDRKRQADERIVFDQRGFDEGVRVRSSSARTRLTFQPMGGVSAGSNVTFTLCAAGEPGRARALTLANSGRLRQSKASTSRASKDCL